MKKLSHLVLPTLSSIINIITNLPTTALHIAKICHKKSGPQTKTKQNKTEMMNRCTKVNKEAESYMNQ